MEVVGLGWPSSGRCRRRRRWCRASDRSIPDVRRYLQACGACRRIGGDHATNPGCRHRQHLPRRRRIRPRGAPARPDSGGTPTDVRRSTTASGACTWPTTCSTGGTRWCSSTRSPTAVTPGTLHVFEADHESRLRPQPVSMHTAWTPPRCSPAWTRSAEPAPHHRRRLRGRQRRGRHRPDRPGRSRRPGARSRAVDASSQTLRGPTPRPREG